MKFKVGDIIVIDISSDFDIKHYMQAQERQLLLRVNSLPDVDSEWHECFLVNESELEFEHPYTDFQLYASEMQHADLKNVKLKFVRK